MKKNYINIFLILCSHDIHDDITSFVLHYLKSDPYLPKKKIFFASMKAL